MTFPKRSANGRRPTASLASAPQPVSAAFLHDLRTPLNQIMGFSEMLAEQAIDEGRADLVPDLDKIRRAGGQMLAVINERFVPEAADGGSVLRPHGGPAYIGTDKSDGMDAANECQSASNAARGVLLVVDDNEMNRDVLSRRLKRQGHDVVMAESGREAMEAVHRQAFDLVLLDIMMPEMSGYDVLQELKADAALRHIPVIMISALHELDSVVRCIEMGAEDYLFKPFDPHLLKARVGACLENKAARDREIRLFAQLKQNYKRLEECEKMRDDLTHMIVHDLRTPLTSVISGIMTLDAACDLKDEQREMVGIALAGGETLLGMINDLLDVEKMEACSMALEYTLLSVADLVESAVHQIAALALDKRLILIRNVSPDLRPLSADGDKLRRTLVNLLGNAIKFTAPGGTVTIEAGQIEVARSITFSVSDTGEGIPEEAFERIFEKFGQVELREAGRTMSTGLGLTFCKLAVEAHGGHIKVESVPGHGSTFSFTIPNK